MPSKRLQSPGVRRVLTGLKAVADQQGVPVDGRFVDFSLDGAHDTVVLGVCPGHSGNENYQAVFPPVPSAE